MRRPPRASKARPARSAAGKPSVSAGTSAGPFAAAVFASNFSSNGYRANNRYRQESAVGDFRYTTDIGSYYLNISGDVQHLGLPGARLVQESTGINQLITDPAGATTPYDDTRTHRSSVTTGFTWMLAPGAELIVDGGMRQKEQRAFFFGSFLDPASPDPKSYFEATLGTSSVTPRLKINSGLFGLPTRALGGVDFYRTGYDSPRSMFREAAPIHRYDLSQMSLATYWQQTVTLPTNTDLAAGYRWQRTSIKASDQLDLSAPGAFPLFCDPVFGCFGDTQGIPLNRHEDNRAYHLGFEHRFNAVLSVFGRHASSFRVPNVDERVGMVTAQNGVPTTFDLRTQRSKDFEGGVRVKAGPLDAQWSIYDMHLVDEIYFRYAPGFIVSNTNLDPTRRYGNETIVNSAPERCRTAQGRLRVHALDICRGHVFRPRRSAGLQTDRELRRHLGYLAKIPHRRRHGPLYRRAPDGQRPVRPAAGHSRAHAGRRAGRRAVRRLVLVTGGAESLQPVLLRLRHREPVPVRARQRDREIQRLSATAADLCPQGGRKLLNDRKL